MKKAILILLLIQLSCGFVSEETGSLAAQIIRRFSPGAYNPMNRSEAEMRKSVRENAKLRLNHLMATSDIPEELRICYAITLLDRLVKLHGALGSGSAALSEANAELEALTDQLMAIQNEK
jgi:hypothetical protein